MAFPDPPSFKDTEEEFAELELLIQFYEEAMDESSITPEQKSEIIHLVALKMIQDIEDGGQAFGA